MIYISTASRFLGTTLKSRTSNMVDKNMACIFVQCNKIVSLTLFWPPARERETRHALQWRHNERRSVSNHQPHDCLLNRLFRRRSKKTSKLRLTGLCVGNSPGTGEFPAQMASYVENVSIWWRHHLMTSPLDFPHRPVTRSFGQNFSWSAELWPEFFLIRAWTNGLANNRDARDAHYDVTITFNRQVILSPCFVPFLKAAHIVLIYRCHKSIWQGMAPCYNAYKCTRKALKVQNGTW